MTVQDEHSFKNDDEKCDFEKNDLSKNEKEKFKGNRLDKDQQGKFAPKPDAISDDGIADERLDKGEVIDENAGIIGKDDEVVGERSKQ